MGLLCSGPFYLRISIPISYQKSSVPFSIQLYIVHDSSLYRYQPKSTCHGSELTSIILPETGFVVLPNLFYRSALIDARAKLLPVGTPWRLRVVHLGSIVKVYNDLVVTISSWSIEVLPQLDFDTAVPTLESHVDLRQIIELGQLDLWSKCY